jgi:hypothetical protein
MKENIPLIMFTYLIMKPYLKVVRNRIIYSYPQCKMNLWYFQQQFKKLFGLKKINHLSFCENKTDSLLVHSDNQVAISYTKDLKYHSKIKHVDTKIFFARDMMVKK